MTDSVVGSSMSLVDAAAKSLNNGAINLINALPNAIAAVVIAVLGLVVANIIAMLLRKLFVAIKFEGFLAQHRLQDALGKVKLSDALVLLIKYYILLVFVQAAVALLALGTISEFLANVTNFAPKVIGAILVVIVAAIAGELFKEKFMEIQRKEPYMQTLGTLAKYLTIFVGVVMGLDALGFQTSLLTAVLVTFLQTAGAAIALAIGLAFGLGGQEAAKSWIGTARKRLEV